jgi:hypothetical protein
MPKSKGFWRIYSADGLTELLDWDPAEQLEEGETVKRIKAEGVTWREYAELMDHAAADSHYSALEGMHEWLARRIIRAAGDGNRVEGEIMAQKVMQSIYQEYGGLHGVY